MDKDENASRRPGKRRWVTMAEVAGKAGVSKITVSRVLKSPEKVRADTRERVLQAVRELGYMPDENAGAFSSRRSRMIGALISTLGGSTFESTVRGLSETLREAGYQLLLATTDYSPEKEAEILGQLLTRRPDGIVLTSTLHTATARRLLSRAEVPVVELWELPDHQLHSAVGFSNFTAGRDMTEHLIARGYQRIGFIGPRPERDERSSFRAEGYKTAIRAIAGFEPRIVSASDSATVEERGAVGLVTLLERWPDTQAVFCSSDQIALGALTEAQRRGLRVPDQIAIAGFGDFEFSREHGLELTTVRIPGHQIGVRAARLLIDFWEAPDGRHPQTVDLGYKVISRRTA